MKYILLFATVFILSFSARAQNAAGGKGRISGKITDATTKAPVDYATVTIFKQGTTTVVNGATSDPKGNFVIDNLPFGEYQVTVDFIGYTRFSLEHVVLGSTKTSVVLNNIAIASATKQLKGVEIVGRASTVENRIDKMVYNPGNDLTAQGGVATDVLKKVPMVTVDIDGNVELQGNANVRFLINGKPSSIFGASLADALQSIPASQIKSIEVITSPGAKYDASGTGGIINIILKDSKVQGFNGTVNTSIGTRLENGSLNLNARKGNFGVSAFFSGNAQLYTTTNSINDKQSYSNTRDTTIHLAQNGSNRFTRSGYQSGLSFNWSITPKDDFTASVGFNHFGNHSYGLTTADEQHQLSTGNVFQDVYFLRNATNRFNANATDYNLSYKKTFKRENQELDVLYTASSSKNTSDFTQNQFYPNGIYMPTGTIGNNPGKDNQSNISVDYVQPVSKNFSFETGVKGVFETLNSSTITDTLVADGSYVQNPNQTYAFNYTRNIYAAYLSLKFSVFNNFIDGQTGLRYERTNTKADFPGANIPGYNTFAPSYVFSHKINETQTIKASFTYRIQRPDYGALNPFFNISDPRNISTGNPNLKPEIGHNYELGYNKSFEKGGNIYVAAFYRYNTDDIQSYTTYYPVLNINGTDYPNVSLTQRYNIGSETTTGVNFFGSAPVTSKLSLRTNMFIGERVNKNPGNPTVTGVAYRINLNGTYQFGHDLTAEVFGNYNSSQRTIQGTRPAFAFYNLAVRKQLWNKKASIGLTAANPFNQYFSQKTTTTGANFDQYNIRQVPFRSFGISLSYKFGKLEFKKKDENENDQNGQQGEPEK
ncbi:MAG: TonB-dependent receptor [Mucilaginibacter sp.]|uniref:TonB-dependent receptor domain-containing protein n=1 Tax=Mucilaginibacter sp. TaxID=1882438 RepID=UPI0034E4B0C9